MPYIYKTGRAELYDQIKRYANLIGGRVLDIGAGKVTRYRNLCRYHEYVRMDVVPGQNVDAVGRIEAIPFTDKTFDSILCTQVLGDVYELERAFKEIYRVLKPNGVALITESLFDPLHSEPNDFWRFTEHSLRRLATSAGLTVEVLERRGGYHSVMAQLRARYWVERLDAHRRWFARPLSFILKIIGTIARRRDSGDQSQAARLFTHGYLLIARKNV